MADFVLLIVVLLKEEFILIRAVVPWEQELAVMEEVEDLFRLPLDAAGRDDGACDTPGDFASDDGLTRGSGEHNIGMTSSSSNVSEVTFDLSSLALVKHLSFSASFLVSSSFPPLLLTATNFCFVPSMVLSFASLSLSPFSRVLSGPFPWILGTPLSWRRSVPHSWVLSLTPVEGVSLD